MPHKPFEDFSDLVLDLVIQNQVAAAELRHHRNGHVVGRGPQAAAGDDEIYALIGHEAQLRLDVVGAVAADRDVRQLDAQFQQPIGDPGAVSVLDAPGEDFGSGDHDARACAHRREPTHRCGLAGSYPILRANPGRDGYGSAWAKRKTARVNELRRARYCNQA